jgi:hypothetical protein
MVSIFVLGCPYFVGRLVLLYVALLVGGASSVGTSAIVLGGRLAGLAKFTELVGVVVAAVVFGVRGHGRLRFVGFAKVAVGRRAGFGFGGRRVGVEVSLLSALLLLFGQSAFVSGSRVVGI